MTVIDDTYTGHVESGTCAATGDSLLIDAANDAETLIDVVRRYAPRVSLIVTSHQHFDHWQALEALTAETGAATAAHRLDAEPLPVTPDRLLSGGDTVRVGELEFDVIHLRGHSPGSVALALSGDAVGGVTQLFSGDCLFPGGVGKTWQDGDFERLLDDVCSRVFDVYDDATVVYPGHGDDTTLGAERPHLAEWRERGW
jgi:glyoxylase-like metal-dependent hydrolase (beta-lactamase superfamily II)